MNLTQTVSQIFYFNSLTLEVLAKTDLRINFRIYFGKYRFDGSFLFFMCFMFMFIVKYHWMYLM